MIDTTFDGIPVRLYKPTATHSELRAGIFYIHGGGWVFGSAGECSIDNLADLIP